MASAGPDLRRRSPLLLEHIREVEGELADWARRRPSFDFEVDGGDVFLIMELLYSYPKRAHDLASATRAMMALGLLTPAVILARALIETTAMGCFYVKEMRRLIERGSLGPLRQRFRTFHEGRVAGDVSPAPVAEALRHLLQLDSAHFEGEIAGGARGADRLDLAAPKFVETSYALLGEAAHPSSLSTHLLYPAPGGPDLEETKLRLEFAVELAIWQAGYLIAALEAGEALPKAYREKFMTVPPPRRGATSAGDRRRAFRATARDRAASRDRGPSP